MEESVLIITQGSHYGKKIADTFLINNYKVIKTITEQEIEISKSQGSGKETQVQETQNLLTEITWNYRSPFSYKNIILNIKNHPDIKNYIIIFSIPDGDTPIHKQNQIEIQKIIDLYIKSQLAITCELLSEFSKNNKSANLFLVLENSNSNNPFKEFIKNFINTILDDNSMTININAFEIGKEPPESFAEYVFSIMKDKKTVRGKWFKQSRYTLF